MRRTTSWTARVLAILTLLLAVGPASASVEAELAFHRGVVAYGENRYDDAEAQFRKVLGEDPEDTAALHYLGLIAQERKDPAAAIGFFDQALAIDPEETDIALDRGIALLDAGRVGEARAALQQVVQEDPSQARAHFFLGVALYRQGDFEPAGAAFDRAAEIDPSLRDEARYYTGLSQILSGNPEAAIAALSEVEDLAPLSPLSRSAQNLRAQMAPAREDRSWRASITAGMEWDDNPLISGATAAGIPVNSAESDFRGVIRPSASWSPYSTEKFRTNIGYDGYLSLHIEEKQVDLQIHNPWGSIGYDLGPFRFGLRQDYSYTQRDLTTPFRHLARTTPSIGYRPNDWSYTSLFYNYDWKDFLNPLLDPSLNRDGWRHGIGLSQLFFLPKPFTYVRFGVYGDFNRTEGSEYQYDGFEANFGAGYDFPYQISLTWLYRFVLRDYDNPSFFSVNSSGAFSPFTQKRKDYRNILTFELRKGLSRHWSISTGGSFTWNKTKVNFYDYSRHIVGTYVTYSF